MLQQRPGSARSRFACGWNAVLCFLAIAACEVFHDGMLLQAGDWRQWRGPERNAVSTEVGLLQSWPEGGPQLAWRSAGIGTGFASVVVSRGLIYTMGCQDSDVVVTALAEESGKLAWVRKFSTTKRVPCSTPTVDEDRLYALDPDGDLVCLNAVTGDVIWQKSFLNDFAGRMMSGRGYGESPLIDGENLICSPGGPEAAIVALNKRTGAVVWQAKLPELGAAGRDGAGFSSIVAMEVAGVKQYVQLMGRGAVGVAAADGRFLWGYNSIANDTANIPTPVVRGDLVFVANGYNAGSVLLQIVPVATPGSADAKAPEIFDAKVVYKLNSTQFQNHHGGVVLVGDHLFGGHGNNNGLPTCLDFKTGEVLWKRRGPGIGSAAVIYADGHLCFRYQNGLVALIAASNNGYQLDGTLEIPGAGGDSWAHPVIAHGRLYLREQDALWVYHLRSEQGAVVNDPIPASLAGNATAKALYDLGVLMEVLPEQQSAVTSLVGTPPGDAISEKRIVDKATRLYQFGLETPRSANSAKPLVISVSRKSLTEKGEFSGEFIDLLKQMTGTLFLNLAGTHVTGAALQQLQACPQIVGLNLELCGRVDDAALLNLQAYPHLRVLILTGTAVTDEGLKSLVPITTLRALDLEVCDGITNATCETLGTLRQLRALVLKKTGFERTAIADDGLLHLKQLSDLELLNLYGNKITDAGLAHLAGLTKLRELNLSLLAITDSGLAQLTPLAQLEQLDLLYSVGFAGPKFTDGVVESLDRFQNLRELNLTGARLTDSGLERLQSLKKLDTLQLVHTDVSAAGIKKFQAAVPNCRVIREGN